jgi:hypothetical protein
VHVQDEETEVTPSVEYIESEATTEEVDLFNNQGRVLITNIPNGKWEERKIPRTGVEPVTFSM